MTNKKFSDFQNANNLSAVTPVGLQGGANVQIPPTAMAKAIADAIALSVSFTFAGNITANNLSGTNTGDETPATLIAKGATIVYAGTAAGTNTYTVTASPVPASYVNGMFCRVTFTNANTGASTINFNGLGAKAIQFKGSALTGGEIPTSATIELFYDGTQFQIIGAGGGSSLTTKQDSTNVSTSTNTLDVQSPLYVSGASSTATISTPSWAHAAYGGI